jgi:Resolvase, N terminal domain
MTPMKHGYARVSTDGQSVDAQVRQLVKTGCKKVFREVASGAKTDRAQLRRVTDQLGQRLLWVEVAPRSAVVLPSIEDMVADRLGQHATPPASDDSRLLQARALFGLAENLDIEYLSRCIREEGGDPTLLGLPDA